jgi:hypothetical protein
LAGAQDVNQNIFTLRIIVRVAHDHIEVLRTACIINRTDESRKPGVADVGHDQPNDASATAA